MIHAPERGRWLREPLLHFLAVGAGLFLVYQVVGGGDSDAPREIVISEPRLEALAENFARTWARPPTGAEMRGLVDDYVKEEVFYREAVAMGLDRDDTVIRRRLRQKMEFVSEDAAATAEPTDAQLRQFLAAHPEKFAEPGRVTFQQVFVNPQKRGDTAMRDAKRMLVELRSLPGPTQPAAAGDPTLLPAGLERASPQEISNTFGDEFGAQMETAPVGEWSGPIASGFGLHLILVTARSAGAMPGLDQIRPIVVREWQAQQRTLVGDAFYSSLRSGYEVRYEGEIGRLLQQAPDATAQK